jgi:hypothetical protein
MNPITELRWEKIELPVQKYGSPCPIDSRRLARARRQHRDLEQSRTFRAAGRLARYRLAVYVRGHGLTPVTDVDTDMHRRYEHDDAVAFATVLAVCLPPGVTLPDGFRMPERHPYLSVIWECSS